MPWKQGRRHLASIGVGEDVLANTFSEWNGWQAKQPFLVISGRTAMCPSTELFVAGGACWETVCPLVLCFDHFKRIRARADWFDWLMLVLRGSFWGLCESLTKLPVAHFCLWTLKSGGNQLKSICLNFAPFTRRPLNRATPKAQH